MEERREHFVQINDKLRQHRIQHNWRQQDVAEQLGISVVTVQRWEQGSQRPSTYYRIKLSELFQASIQELGLTEATTQPPVYEASDARPTHITLTENIEFWTVPYTRNIHFTGHEKLLHDLERHFFPQEANMYSVSMTQSQAIKGLGA